MSRLLSLILLFGFGASLVFAAMDSTVPLGQTIKDFVWPKRNDQGELEANISGASATAVSVNRTTIQGLKIEMYDGKQVETVLTSPKSDYWVQENRLSSQSGVVLKNKDMTVTAQSMDWDLKGKTAVLRKQVRVVLDNVSIGGPATGDEKATN